MKKEKLKISEMRNLGLAFEKDINAGGVFSADQVIKLGPEKAFLKMLEGRLKTGRSAKCCNALYLYSLYGAIHDIDWRMVPTKQKEKYKALTEKLRESGKYS
jgi:hypothetical protein